MTPMERTSPMTGELLWQAAFIGQDALHTLAVEELSLYGAMDDLNLPEHGFVSDLWPGVEQHFLESLVVSGRVQTAPTTGIATP
ncbi:hypothetical protein DXG01_005181 [Tephrocybe rancida]|nr:hypothetical protein DXG01_005181 [Tephrocybe rancida]